MQAHAGPVLAKSGVRNRVEAAISSYEAGLVPPGQRWLSTRGSI
ncbi:MULTISPECIES: hypothetical protein [Streptomyces]|nr:MULTISPECIES: hypothetical protein [Streptomyces]